MTCCEDIPGGGILGKWAGQTDGQHVSTRHVRLAPGQGRVDPEGEQEGGDKLSPYKCFNAYFPGMGGRKCLLTWHSVIEGLIVQSI